MFNNTIYLLIPATIFLISYFIGTGKLQNFLQKHFKKSTIKNRNYNG